MPIGRPPVNTVDAGLDPFAGSTKKARPKRPKGKLSKSDISAPSDFRHLSHVGFDPTTGAFDVSVIVNQLSSIIFHLITEQQYCSRLEETTGHCWCHP